MKKTLFLSLVTCTIIFTGCGGGGGDSTSGGSTSGGSTSGGSTSGGSTSGGSTSGGSTSGGSTSGGTAKTYTKFTYPATNLENTISITVETDGNWTVNPNGTIALADRSPAGMGYTDAVKWCSDKNLTFPGPNDLLALPAPAGVTSAWAKDRYTVNYTDKTIGQAANEDNDIKIVVCLTKNSTTLDKKHTFTDINATAREDSVTGLQWTPFIVYDEDLINPGHANQSRFPISGAVAPQLNAEAYCQTFGADWRLPTLSELRTAVYFDGETLPSYAAIGKKPSVIWTSTPFGTNKHYVVNLNTDFTGLGTHGIEDDTFEAYVTCVKSN